MVEPQRFINTLDGFNPLNIDFAKIASPLSDIKKLNPLNKIDLANFNPLD